MSYTKGELVQTALGHLGIADFEFDATADEIVSGVRQLDSMIAYWNAKNINIGYPVANNFEGSSTAQDSGVSDIYVDAVTYNLALRLAPGYGKEPTRQVKVMAKQSLNAIMGSTTPIKERQLPVMPKGAAYKNPEWQFTRPPQEQYLENVDNSVDFTEGESYE